MKIANNKLSALLKYYQTELHQLYDSDELYAIFELVCEHYLKYSKKDVKSNINELINQSDLINLYNTCNELKTAKPIQYILKEAYFYELKFKVDESVLIPRPETEELVFLIINETKQNKTKQLKMLDMGTGSGCIPIALKTHVADAKVYGIDISLKALDIAKTNSQTNNTFVEFYSCDILTTKEILNAPFDYIISNPPYVLLSESEQMEKRVLEFEPSLALFVEENDPIIFYKKIIDLCLNSLTQNGYLFFELNPLFANDVYNYATLSHLFQTIEIITDMSGKQRFFKAQKK